MRTPAATHFILALSCSIFTSACAPEGNSILPTGDEGPIAAAQEPGPSGTFSPSEPTTMLHYLSNGQGAKGAHVLVYNRSGKLLSRGTTDAAGFADVAAPAHATITVADPSSGALTTVVDIEEGEPISIGRSPADPVRVKVDQRVLLTTPAHYEGASRYRLVTGATDVRHYSLPSSITLKPSELGLSSLGHFDVMIIAEDGNGDPMAYTALRNVAPLEQMTLGEWRTDFAVVTMDAYNIPASAQPSFTLEASKQNQRNSAVYGTPMAVASDRTSRSFRYVPGAERFTQQLEIAAPGRGGAGMITVAKHALSAASVDAQLLPAFISSAVLAIHEGAPSVKLSPAPRRDFADAVVTKLAWARGEWTVVAPTPTDGAPVSAPALPEDLSYLNPDSSTRIVEALAVGYLGDGYAPIRRRPQHEVERILTGSSDDDRTGSLRYARY